MTRALLCCAMVACGGVDPEALDEADIAAPPSPFTLQFTGTYEGATRLELRRDGSYALDGHHGRFRAPHTRKSLPLKLQLGRRSASIEAWDGKLHLDSGETLQLDRPATSDEELCDATGGQWTDDDADPATGLYCVCAPPAEFIPSSGGCVP